MNPNESPDHESLRNQIIHRYQNNQSARGIARDLGISRWKAARIILQHRQSRDADHTQQNAVPPAGLGSPPAQRGSKLDPFAAQLEQLLQRYPRITATRAFEELKRSGYDGGYTILRDRIRQLRVRPAKPLTVRFETAPGVQAQMDWATYEIDFTQEGKRRVNLFSYLLGYSRRQYIHFTQRQDFDTTIRQHIKAFEHLGGVAAVCLYDNMKVAVTRWEDDSPVYNTRFLAFATHYGYKPWACQVRRPQTKGKVERPFYYVETNLLNGREFRSLEHLNEVARWWLSQVADVRVHGTTKQTPLALHAEELPHLLPLPTLQFDTAQVVYRVVDSEGTIQYATNRYSVPWQLVGEQLPVRILAHQGTPKPAWQQLSESGQESLRRLAESEPIGPRHSQEYQDLLYGTDRPGVTLHEPTSEKNQAEITGSSEISTNSSDVPGVDLKASGNAEDPADGGRT